MSSPDTPRPDSPSPFPAGSEPAPADPWATSWDSWDAEGAAGDSAGTSLGDGAEVGGVAEAGTAASGGGAAGEWDLEAAITTNSIPVVPMGANEPDAGWRPQGWSGADAEEAAGAAAAAGPRASELMTGRGRSERARAKAQSGWRKSLGLGPGAKERLEMSRVERIVRPLDGRKTVMVINTKGGGGKTLVTLMLAAYLGRYRTGSVLAWDNNETEGTLGMRAPSSPHHRTVVDLLSEMPSLAVNPVAGPSELQRFVREQAGLGFDVLASADDDEAMRIVGEQEFEELHGQLSRFYRMIIIDTGNNRLSPNWLAAVRHADLLVFATSLKDDTSVVAAKNLDALVAAGREDLVRNAVCVISHTTPRTDGAASGVRTREHFEKWVRRVVDIPYDVALTPGLNVDPRKVSAKTHEACLEMTAAVVDGL